MKAHLPPPGRPSPPVHSTNIAVSLVGKVGVLVLATGGGESIVVIILVVIVIVVVIVVPFHHHHHHHGHHHLLQCTVYPSLLEHCPRPAISNYVVICGMVATRSSVG